MRDTVLKIILTVHNILAPQNPQNLRISPIIFCPHSGQKCGTEIQS